MKSSLKVHFSSATDDWATPQAFFDKMNERYGPFTLDAAANYYNRKCEFWLGKGQGEKVLLDGLTVPWKHQKVWLNPPYGRGIGKWVQKAYEESQKGCLVVCLLPSRTDTKWFHDYCTKGEIEFIKGRLKFGNAKNAAPFPSMIVVFRPKEAK